MVEAGWRRHWPLYALAVAALLTGIYSRFKGLGAAPLAIDEYYLIRSADNIRRFGWPFFECSGWYSRGLLLQYLIVPLRAFGLPPELAPRMLCAVGSLIALPAAYILGYRAHSRTVGLLLVVLLSVSVWEVEMARFGRMYAPFQALFLWYLVFLIRYTVDRDLKAVWPMLALTIIAPFVWEGGVFLAFANLLPVFFHRPSGKLSGTDWAHLGVSAVLLAAIYWFASTEFRFTDAPAWPAGYLAMKAFKSGDAYAEYAHPLTILSVHPLWIGLLALPMGAALFALRWILRRYRFSWAAAGLGAAVIAAVFHQFTLVIAAIVLVLLLRFATWRDVFSRPALPFHAAIALSAIFWVAFTLTVVDWQANPLAAAHKFAQFPDVADVIARPWFNAIPMLGLGLLLLLAAGIVRAMLQGQEGVTVERALLVTFICLILAVGASHPPRHETRYVFFLYPLALLIALSTLTRSVALIGWLRNRSAEVVAIAALSAFALSEDFSLRHLLNIDRPSTIFRANLPPARASHLVSRADSHAIARWLRENATRPGDLVISGYHSLEYYFPKIHYSFVDWRDANFDELSCRKGTVDRWNNLPLLYTADSLRAAIGTKRRTFIVMFTSRVDELRRQMTDWHPSIELSTQNVSIMLLQAGAAPK